MFTRRSFTGGAMAVGASLLGTHTSAQPPTKPTTILGVDTYSYPGARALQKLWSDFSYRIIGFYLSHSPSKIDHTWLSQRGELAKAGWGLFPTFLGYQHPNPPPGLGTKHGAIAVGLMQKAGFPPNSVVYLDVETPKESGGAFQVYMEEWMKVVRAANFYPGVYCSYKMAENRGWVTKLTSAVWTVELPIAKKLISPALPIQKRVVVPYAYDPAKNPYGIIREGCIATQYKWYQSVKGVPHLFDFDSSLVADPSNAGLISEVLQVPKLI